MRPIVQVSLKNFEQRKQEITKELWDAANDVGFFYLKDHGLTEASFNGRCRIVRALLFGRSDRPAADTLADTDAPGIVNTIVRIKMSYCLQDEIQHMFSISKAFFDLPADVKVKYRFDLVRPPSAVLTLLISLLSVTVRQDSIRDGCRKRTAGGSQASRSGLLITYRS